MDNKFIIELEFAKQFFTFEKPLKIISSYTFSDIETCLAEIEIYKKLGKYIAGFFSYEHGYFFEPSFYEKFQSVNFKFPLLYFGVYETYSSKPLNNEDSNNFSIKDLTQSIDFAEYEKSFLHIKEKIKLGETYQVNFTFSNHFNFSGSAYSFYQELKRNQIGNYSGFLETDSLKIISASPELFFEIKNSSIQCKPMKGTLEKGDFQIDPKIKSENHIIVDLIRNDLGKISKLGTVQVNSLLELEKYDTLNQITSTIGSELKEDLTVLELLRALIPAGSITGAPKKRTMEIILEEEADFREIYTGGIGFFSKHHSVFSIPIRTVQLENGMGTLGIGSGIIFDSDAKKEWEESNLKMRFFLKSIPISIFESILFKNKKIYFLIEHIARLKKSALYFGFRWNEEELKNHLAKISLEESFDSKLKLSLNRKNEFSIQSVPLGKKFHTIQEMKIAETKTNSKDIFYYHKTSLRDIYDAYREKAVAEKCFEYIFFNEKDELTEGSISNIFILIDKVYYTPSVESGILAGVYRNKLLKRNGFKERKLYISDLENAKEIFLCNSVRGIVRVRLNK